MLIVGLGNPGPRYETTRHNAGFILVDLLADKFGLTLAEQPKFKSELAKGSVFGVNCHLLKPLTFMNLSGDAVAAYARFFKIPASEIIVVHDDIDTPAGKVKARMGGSHGGNNGVRDIIAKMGTDQFKRIKLGVGKPQKPEDGSVSDWVLRPFTDEQLQELGQEMFDDMLLRLKGILDKA